MQFVSFKVLKRISFFSRYSCKFYLSFCSTNEKTDYDVTVKNVFTVRTKV